MSFDPQSLLRDLFATATLPVVRAIAAQVPPVHQLRLVHVAHLPREQLGGAPVHEHERRVVALGHVSEDLEHFVLLLRLLETLLQSLPH